MSEPASRPQTEALPDEPHHLPVERLISLLDVEVEPGLRSAQIKARRQRFGKNVLRRHQPAGVFNIVINQLKSPVVYLLAAAALLAGGLGEWADFTAILAVLAINTMIGFVTEIRAMRSMEALRQLSASSVRVRRDHQHMVIPADDLVPGDIVVLDAGDVITADMRVISSANLSSDESALTGESLPVAKSPQAVAIDTALAERTSMLYKGCAITRGTGEGLVTATGMQTELGRITHLVEHSEPERSPLERQLERLSRDLIWITLAVAAAVALAGIYVGQNIPLMVETAVALAVAAIPEGLPIVATLALARGMLRMARRNALIERLSAVETLGATTVIMTDKTGTLTENRMHVDRIVTPVGEIAFDRQAGTFLLGGRPVSVGLASGLDTLLRAAALCNNAALHDDGAGGTGDPMEVALLEAALAGGLRKQTLHSQYPEVAEHAFDAGTKMMATVHQSNGGYLIAVKGAPEAVFERLSKIQSPDGLAVPFDDRISRNWQSYCDLLASQGLRLLAIAGKPARTAQVNPYADLTLYGVIGLQDPPRSDVAAALADARRAGIKVVMVTGDHALTAKSISQTVGLAPAGTEVFKGEDLTSLKEMSEQDKAAARAALVFSRVSPEQKLDLITLHQQAGEFVAMTGDGVNDAPALKKAEIGIAMGQRGTQVAREAADMVLRDDAFSTIIHAVREGRIIYTNIRRFTTYLLSCNLSEILVIGLAVLGGLPLPLLPLQILFLNLVTDVFPAFALGTIEADRDVLERPPRPPSEPILSGAQWQAIIIHGAIISFVTLTAAGMAIYQLGMRDDQITTMCFFTLALAQLWHVFNMRNWREGPVFNQLTRNTFVWLSIAICIALLTLAAFEPHLASVLHIVPLAPEAWTTILGLSILPVLMREVAAIFVRTRRRHFAD
ncbi:MAG: cation-transporting P-type ATPase [Rhizobiales bacterium]|nr:cation-transporting P-type ATPase [Hyphomicrobiales bacterium]